MYTHDAPEAQAVPIGNDDREALPGMPQSPPLQASSPPSPPGRGVTNQGLPGLAHLPSLNSLSGDC